MKTILIKDVIDVQIKLNSLMWVMDDTTYNNVAGLIQTHIDLIQESINTNTNLERMMDIKCLVESLKASENSIINEFIKGMNL